MTISTVDAGSSGLSLSVVAPGGQAMAVSQRQGNGRFEATVPGSGVYTVHVSATNPANPYGAYTLYLTGAGQEFRGTVDPFKDARDSGYVYDTVDLKVDRAGVYQVSLWAGKFH